MPSTNSIKRSDRRAARGPLAALCLVAALAVAGCGSSSDTKSAASTPAATTTSAAAGGAAAPTTATVGMEGVSFKPTTITVKAGGSVTWDNTSTISHNVTADAFASKTLDPGAKFVHRFDTAGSYPFVCTFHAGMKGTIVVQ